MRLYGWYTKYNNTVDKRRVHNFNTPKPTKAIYDEAIASFTEKEGPPNRLGIRLEDKRDWMGLTVVIMKPPPGHFYLWIENKK